MIKNIKVDEKLHKKLFQLKLNLNIRSLDEVVGGLYNLMKKLNLMKDLKIMIKGGK